MATSREAVIADEKAAEKAFVAARKAAIDALPDMLMTQAASLTIGNDGKIVVKILANERDFHASGPNTLRFDTVDEAVAFVVERMAPAVVERAAEIASRTAALDASRTGAFGFVGGLGPDTPPRSDPRSDEDSRLADSRGRAATGQA